MHTSLRRFTVAAWVGAGLWAGLLGAAPAWAAHAYAQFGEADIGYPAGFTHWRYVNPQAPKGGELVLVPPTRISTFDKYNPFTLKGTAPPGLSGLLLESLLTSNFDEPTTGYGLLAEDVSVSADHRSATFRLREGARFHNGDPVRAIDVQATFERLMGPGAAPQWPSMLGDVARVVVVSEREVRFEFKQGSAEQPLIVGAVPIFSHRWGQGKAFDQVVTEPPVGSGPYRIGPVNFGRDITYVRDPQYWGQALPAQRGLYNFDRITYKIYKDNTAQFEAFKAGEFDVIQAFIAREWARQYVGPKFASGELVRRELPHGNAGDFQGFMFNTRRPQFQDVRVRRALAMAMDFEWMNRQLFYNAYTRVRGFFPASDFEAQGRPEGDERAVLEAVRAALLEAQRDTALPLAVLNDEVPQAPSTAPPGSLRDNLREARRLLAEAGWTIQNGALRNARGEPFTLEFLDNSGSMGRIVSPMLQNLGKLGIAAQYKVVDFALLQKRTDTFDFDVISNRLLGSEAPGVELLDRFSSASARTEGSNNVIGVSNPAVDALVQRALAAKTRPELVAHLRALDRVLRHGHYVIPQWFSSVHRVAWRGGKFGMPESPPRYYQPEAWVTQTWWSQPAP